MSDVPPQDTPQKQCSCCSRTLAATPDFFRAYKNRSGIVMLRGQRKQCEKESRKKHYHENREKNQKYALNYYYAHREDMIEKSKKYRKTHREKDRRYALNYYYAHHNEMVEKNRIYYQLHSKELNAKTRKYYQIRRNDLADYGRRYYHNHVEERREYRQKYYQIHRERLNVQKREYFQTEHGKMIRRTNHDKRRSQKLHAVGSHTAQQLKEQLQRQKHLCYYCHKKLDTQWHADHVVPLSRGGSDDIHNIVITCKTCNLSKHNKLPHEWPKGGRLF